MKRYPFNAHLKRVVLAAALAAVIAAPSLCRSKDLVLWQNVDWPPFQILHGEDAGTGCFDVFVRLFQDRLPQYEHRNIEMNWARFWEEVRAGRHVLNAMAIETEERSRYAVFSEVVAFTLPHRIIMRRTSIEEMGNPGSVSLGSFLGKKQLRGIVEKDRSYTIALDRILQQHEAAGTFERKALDTKNILKMVQSGRVDYAIEYPFVVDYVLRKADPGADSRLGSIRIQELPGYVTASIAAPRNAWGIQIIGDVNRVLGQLKQTKDYLRIHQMWHSDPKERERIREIYREVFHVETHRMQKGTNIRASQNSALTQRRADPLSSSQAPGIP